MRVFDGAKIIFFTDGNIFYSSANRMGEKKEIRMRIQTFAEYPRCKRMRGFHMFSEHRIGFETTLSHVNSWNRSGSQSRVFPSNLSSRYAYFSNTKFCWTRQAVEP